MSEGKLAQPPGAVQIFIGKRAHARRSVLY